MSCIEHNQSETSLFSYAPLSEPRTITSNTIVIDCGGSSQICPKTLKYVKYCGELIRMLNQINESQSGHPFSIFADLINNNNLFNDNNDLDNNDNLNSISYHIQQCVRTHGMYERNKKDLIYKVAHVLSHNEVDSKKHKIATNFVVVVSTFVGIKWEH